MNNIGVYIIENNLTKKVYIGSTGVDFEKRFKQHKVKLEKNIHSSKPMQEDYNKLGSDYFSFKILEETKTIEESRIVERKWINELLPEYNMTHRVNKPLVYDENMSIKMSKSKGCKSFEAYKENEYLGTFDCQSICSRQLGIKQSELQRVLIGKIRIVKGFKFKYVGEDFKYISKVPQKKEKKKKLEKVLLE